MAAQYRPALPFATPLILLKPTTQSNFGVATKTFPSVENGVQIFGSFKTYGGTEKTIDGIYVIEDTAEVVTWYTPEITSDCVIVVAGTNDRYSIINEPENIDRRNQFLKFKVKRLKGGA